MPADDQDQKKMKKIMSEELHMIAVLETARDAIITADELGNILFWNHMAEEMFGYESNDVKGRSLTMIMPERFRDAHLKGMQRYVSTNVKKAIGQILELVGLRSNGEEFPIELSLSTWKYGENPHFTAIIRETSERKKLDDRHNLERKELKRMTEIMMNREERIIELKREVNELLDSAGKKARYAP